MTLREALTAQLPLQARLTHEVRLARAYRTKCVSDSEVSTQVDASFSFV